MTMERFPFWEAFTIFSDFEYVVYFGKAAPTFRLVGENTLDLRRSLITLCVAHYPGLLTLKVVYRECFLVF